MAETKGITIPVSADLTELNLQIAETQEKANQLKQTLSEVKELINSLKDLKLGRKTINEIREQYGLQPIKEGDVVLISK